MAFFFFIMDPSGSLINSLKWFCWKKNFAKIFTKNVTLHSVILCQVGLRAGSHCAESDSAQYHTAPSQEIEMSKNPKLSNTVRSRTPRSVKLRQVRLSAVSHCVEFCREQFCLCRPLLAFNDNKKKFNYSVCVLQYCNIAQIFLLTF